MAMTKAQRRYYESERGKAQRRVWYQANAAKLSLKRRTRLDSLRQTAVDKYGGVCACCGETEIAFLCFDHINGGGKKERESRRSHGIGWYRELVAQPVRVDLQILCANCNMAKERVGGCPHTP